MSIVKHAVNFIRSRRMKHRQFRSFLADIESAYNDVVYYSEVRWLSRGTMLKQAFQLRKEIADFMARNNKRGPEFDEQNFINDFSFLLDITTHLNVLNCKLQGPKQLICDMYNHVTAFQAKLQLWKEQLQNQMTSHFPTLSEQPNINHARCFHLLDGLEKRFC